MDSTLITFIYKVFMTIQKCPSRLLDRHCQANAHFYCQPFIFVYERIGACHKRLRHDALRKNGVDKLNIAVLSSRCQYNTSNTICFIFPTACNAAHGIAVAILSVCLSVRLSVCLSVRCVYCDKTKQRTANILIPHETAITLVF